MDNNLRNNYINAIKPLPLTRLSTGNSSANFSSPLRVNFSAGWNDTPPYCNEIAGFTLNAPILLAGKFPVSVTILKLNTPKIVFTNLNTMQSIAVNTMSELLACQSPLADFALPKSCLFASGLIPFDSHYDLKHFLKLLGGFEIRFSVTDIPVGSGLGTSSILIFSCLKALFDFFHFPVSDEELFHMTACSEQIMTTGGGYQDQIGCYCRKVKFISFSPATFATIKCENLELPLSIEKELKAKLCFVYTGCTRTAKNLLDKIVTNYQHKDLLTLNTLHEIGMVAQSMKNDLMHCNLKAFSQNMIKSFHLNEVLNPDFSNPKIQEILALLIPSIDGYMLSGAGNGGFLTLVLKDGISKTDIAKILALHFPSSDIRLYDFNLYL